MIQNREPLTIVIQRIILMPLGIFVDKKNGKYGKLFVYWYTLVLTPPNVFSELWTIFTIKSFLYKLDALVYCLTAILLVSILLSCHWRRQNFRNIYEKVANNRMYMDDNFYKMSEARIKKSFFIIGVIIFCLMMLMIIFPILVAAYTDMGYGSTPTLIYPAATPWAVTNAVKYALVIIYQLTVVSSPMFVEGAIILYTCYIRIIIISLYSNIRRKIGNNIGGMWNDPLARDRLTIGSCTRRQEDEQKMAAGLHDIIRNHQFLLK